MYLFYLVCVSLVISVQVEAQFDESSCASLQPNVNVPPGTANLIVAPIPMSYVAGQTLQVFVASSQAVQVSSLILQAHLEGSNIALGSFDVSQNNGYSLIDCSGSAAGTVTGVDLTSPTGNLPFSLSWTAPNVAVGNIIFSATVVTAGNMLLRASSNPVTGATDENITIDPCPQPTVTGNIAVFQSPGCRRGQVLVRDATCNRESGSVFTNGETVVCTCQDNQETVTCDFQVFVQQTSPCTPNPCLNGGQCIEFGGTNFFCSCVNGFTGDTCGVAPPSAVCAGNPCMTPGAECREDGVSLAGYTCHITAGTPCPTI